MESESIRLLVVNAFDDVDFAIVGPVGTYKPEGWPGAADSSWHVFEVDGKQASFIARFACDADAWTATWSVTSVVNA